MRSSPRVCTLVVFIILMQFVQSMQGTFMDKKGIKCVPGLEGVKWVILGHQLG